MATTMEVTEVVHGEVELSLDENEQIIREGIRSFVEVGEALKRIRDEGQYRQLGFPSFEQYVKERWGFVKSWANDQIAASRVVRVVESGVTKNLGQRPQTPEAARPLFKVLLRQGEEGVARVWERAVESHEGERPVTGAEVKKAAREIYPALYLASTESAQDKLAKLLDENERRAKALYQFVRGNRSRAYDDEMKERLRVEADRLTQQANVLRAMAEGTSLPSSDEMREGWGLDA
jgi:hypothetical protein